MQLVLKNMSTDVSWEHVERGEERPGHNHGRRRQRRGEWWRRGE